MSLSSERRIPAAFVVGAGILVGATMIFALSTPRVAEFLPSSGSRAVSSMARLSLSFNRPMEPLTIESRLLIEPERPGLMYWSDQTLIFEPEEPWPADSTVTVTLVGGGRGINRLPMLGRRSWSFEVGKPSLVYLWPGEGKSDLYQISLEPGADPQQLTDSELGVQEYSVSVDGALLIYSAHTDHGETELRVYDLISKEDRLVLDCEAEIPCHSPVISPDGEWLAFERVEYSLGEGGRLLPSITRVWLMPFRDEAQAIAVSPPEHNAKNPSWAPNGWLVYFDNHLRALALMNPAQGPDSVPFNYIPTNLGLVGSWSPDSTRLMYPDIVFAERGDSDEEASTEGESPLYYSHLYMVDVTSGRTLDVSPGGDWMVEDASPSFSPDGRSVAFTRKFLDAERWTPGRQVWLMDSERTDPQPLTDESGANYSSLAWSPDSERLAFMRKSVANLSQPSEIWWLDVVQGTAVMVVEGAFLPRWIP